MSIIKKLNKILGGVCDAYDDAWFGNNNSKSSTSSSSQSSGRKYDYMNVPDWRCCANCRNFNAHYNMNQYVCLRHMHYFKSSEIEYDKVHHKTICDDYFAK